MKTTNITLNFLMLSVITILMVSCGKNVSSDTNFPLPDQQAGAIVDLGVVNGDLHQMSMTLSNATITMDGLKVASMATSLVYVNLFTNSNGIINNGTYTYSNADNNLPFTFKSGSIYMPNSTSGNYHAFEMNGGNISVTRDGITYYITFEGRFSDGNSFHGSFLGQLTYSDTDIIY